MIRLIPIFILFGICWLCYKIGIQVGIKRGKKVMEKHIPSDELLDSLIVHSKGLTSEREKELLELQKNR